MQVGAGQQCADGDVSVGYVQMELVTAPITQVAFAALLHSQTTAAGQLGQQFWQAHEALLLDVIARGAWRVARGLGAFLITFLLRQWLGMLGISFACFNRRRVAGNMTDETIPLRLLNDGFVPALR